MKKRKTSIQAGALHGLLAPPTRIRILEKLGARASDKIYFTDLLKSLKINPNALAYNLRILREEGKVHKELIESNGKYALYSITDDGREELQSAKK